MVRSKQWNQPWASPDLNSIKALQADQRGGEERERGEKKLFQIPNIVSDKNEREIEGRPREERER